MDQLLLLILKKRLEKYRNNKSAESQHNVVSVLMILLNKPTTQISKFSIRGSLKTYVDFCHNFFSRRHITLGFGTHIWTTNSVDLQKKFSNLTRYFRK